MSGLNGFEIRVPESDEDLAEIMRHCAEVFGNDWKSSDREMLLRHPDFSMKDNLILVD